MLLSAAKQRLEDRLAAAAREKLAQASKECKERQLQAERKKRAALFLQTLKTPMPSGELETTVTDDTSHNMQVGEDQKMLHVYRKNYFQGKNSHFIEACWSISLKCSQVLDLTWLLCLH